MLAADRAPLRRQGADPAELARQIALFARPLSTAPARNLMQRGLRQVIGALKSSIGKTLRVSESLTRRNKVKSIAPTSGLGPTDG
jgi:hypothetical protein